MLDPPGEREEVKAWVLHFMQLHGNAACHNAFCYAGYHIKNSNKIAFTKYNGIETNASSNSLFKLCITPFNQPEKEKQNEFHFPVKAWKISNLKFTMENAVSKSRLLRWLVVAFCNNPNLLENFYNYCLTGPSMIQQKVASIHPWPRKAPFWAVSPLDKCQL